MGREIPRRAAVLFLVGAYSFAVAAKLLFPPEKSALGPVLVGAAIAVEVLVVLGMLAGRVKLASFMVLCFTAGGLVANAYTRDAGGCGCLGRLVAEGSRIPMVLSLSTAAAAAFLLLGEYGLLRPLAAGRASRAGAG